MRVAIKFAYNGKKFFGYARQPKLKTVEGELLNSLIINGIIKDTKDSVFRVASRTDKGVSALGNVISFNTKKSKKSIIESLSNEFDAIIVYGIKDVDLDFYPRYAKLRIYQYYLNISNLDYEKIIDSLSIFTGKHDFTNFARIEPFKNPERTIDNIVYSKNNNFLIIDFYAQNFLWHQIRRIISALIKIGNGKIENERIIKALINPNKKVDFGLAPAEPLILKDVIYDFDFKYYKKQLDKLADLENKIFSFL